nr:unnamed protein product [Digitaria exilis]
METPQIEMGGFKVNSPQVPNGGLRPTMAGSWDSRTAVQRTIRSIRIVIFTSKLNLLMPFGPASIILHFTSRRHGLVFLFSMLGITPLAERLGYATEQLAVYTGPTVQATAVVNSGLLLMAVMGLMFPAVLHFTHSEVRQGASEEEEPNEDATEEEEEAEIGMWEAVTWLAVLTLWVSVLSEYLVNAIEGASDSLNLPVAFISVILLPIVGNAAEHASAIMFAMKDKLDITLGVAIGSSTQISMFLFLGS